MYNFYKISYQSTAVKYTQSIHTIHTATIRSRFAYEVFTLRLNLCGRVCAVDEFILSL